MAGTCLGWSPDRFDRALLRHPQQACAARNQFQREPSLSDFANPLVIKMPETQNVEKYTVAGGDLRQFTLQIGSQQIDEDATSLLR